MTQFYTYIYRDPSKESEPFYVGKGQRNRAYYHLTREDMHPITHRIQKMKRLGIEPIIDIISMNSEAEAFEFECLLIDEIGLENLTNLTVGGRGHDTANTPGFQRWLMEVGPNNPMEGKHHTEETKLKIQLAQVGKKRKSVNLGPKPKYTCTFCNKIVGGKSNIIQHERSHNTDK